MWVFYSLGGLLILFLGMEYCVYLIAFHRSAKREAKEDQIPSDPSYLPYRDQILPNLRRISEVPFVPVSTKSFDGLKLAGKFYPSDNETAFLLMHGYRSNGIRDASGIFQDLRAGGYQILIPDQRAHGSSEGWSITLGAKEKKDCLTWISFLSSQPNVKRIVLMGVSMGASTVLLAGKESLPASVCGIIADCGYSSGKDIIRSVIKNILHWPVHPFYEMVLIASKVFAHFSMKEADVETALKQCSLPILLIHGTGDHFVPHQMSEANYSAASGPKELFFFPNAPHGMSYYQDQSLYQDACQRFLMFALKGEPVFGQNK